jgi:RNA polymerase sigma factor (TIGR02999 family)
VARVTPRARAHRRATRQSIRAAKSSTMVPAVTSPDERVTPLPLVAEGDRWSALYTELRGMAHALMGRERGEHTLQTTALVHEAWMRLGEEGWEHHGQFMAAAARAMRCILTDHARTRGRIKRGNGVAPVPLEGLAIADVYGELVDLLALDAALDRLAACDELAAQIVELRFFAGMTHDEIALATGVSKRTVERTFRLARAYLYDALAHAPEQGPPCPS